MRDDSAVETMDGAWDIVRRAAAPGSPSEPSPATIAERLDRIGTAVTTPCEVDPMRAAGAAEASR